MLLKDSQLIGIIPTMDYEKSRKFYESVLGLSLIEEDAYASVFQSGESKIRVSKVDVLNPSPHPILGWEVVSLEAIARSLATKDITFEKYDFLVQDSMGIWTSPNGEKVAFLKDPDGNLLSFAENGKLTGR